MTEPVYPTLPGLGWSAMKKPMTKRRIQTGVSGRETVLIDQIVPIWEWTLIYDLLRDKNDTRGGPALGAGFDELRTLVGFWLQRQCGGSRFLFEDPSDFSVTGQQIGTGDGTTAAFQLGRGMGGFYEPITAPHVVSHVYVNAVDPTGWTVNAATGLVTMASAPAAAAIITADFTYYFRCRFSEDSAEFENFMYQLWQLKQIKLRSVLL